MNGEYYLGVDLGGTKIAAGLVGGDYRLIDKEVTPTRAPRSAQALCEDIVRLCRHVTEKHGIPLEAVRWIGVGAPGVVWNGLLCHCANLSLHEAPVERLLRELTGRPVYLRNDADAAAYGEYIAGSGRGSHSLVAVTVGTGIGSGIVLGGRIYNGFNCAAAELGHIVVEPQGRVCTCGRRGCLECYCSARALTDAVREAVKCSPDGMLAGLCAQGQGEAQAVFEAAAQGDETALEITGAFLRYLAYGVGNVINLLQPEILCIGGGISALGDRLIVPLRQIVEAQTFPGGGGARTRVLAAELGNDAGIVGAALLGKMA